MKYIVQPDKEGLEKIARFSDTPYGEAFKQVLRDSVNRLNGIWPDVEQAETLRQLQGGKKVLSEILDLLEDAVEFFKDK